MSVLRKVPPPARLLFPPNRVADAWGHHIPVHPTNSGNAIRGDKAGAEIEEPLLRQLRHPRSARFPRKTRIPRNPGQTERLVTSKDPVDHSDMSLRLNSLGKTDKLNRSRPMLEVPVDAGIGKILKLIRNMEFNRTCTVPSLLKPRSIRGLMTRIRTWGRVLGLSYMPHLRTPR